MAPCREPTAHNSDYTCERRGSKDDVSVAGVVMKPASIASHPTTPLDGEVTHGSYDQETPAVYLQ